LAFGKSARVRTVHRPWCHNDKLRSARLRTFDCGLMLSLLILAYLPGWAQAPAVGNSLNLTSQREVKRPSNPVQASTSATPGVRHSRIAIDDQYFDLESGRTWKRAAESRPGATAPPVRSKLQEPSPKRPGQVPGIRHSRIATDEQYMDLESGRTWKRTGERTAGPNSR